MVPCTKKSSPADFRMAASMPATTASSGLAGDREDLGCMAHPSRNVLGNDIGKGAAYIGGKAEALS